MSTLTAVFSSKGIGGFKSGGAYPVIGQVGKLEAVAEERIEVVASAEVLQNVLAAIKQIHPYEEVAIDVFKLEDLTGL